MHEKENIIQNCKGLEMECMEDVAPPIQIGKVAALQRGNACMLRVSGVSLFKQFTKGININVLAVEAGTTPKTNYTLIISNHGHCFQTNDLSFLI